MLALKDADHVVQYDAYKLHKKANLTPQETIDALEVLSKPDKRLKTFKQDFDGRRIQQVEHGWLILNGEKYRSMIQKMKQREYKTQWQRDKRAEQAGNESVVLTGKEAEAYRKAEGKHYTKRKKVVENAGATAGATTAMAEGLDIENAALVAGEPSPFNPDGV